MRILSFLFVVITFSLCTAPAKEDVLTDDELRELSLELAHKYIVADGHVDIPYRLREEMEDISIRTEKGDFDYIRSKEGGLDAPFMSIYIPSEYQETGGSKALADSLIDMVEGLVAKDPDKFALAFSPDMVEQNFKNELISLPMGMENGAPVESDLGNLKHFFDRGIRYITLTHARDNEICDSSYDTTRTWNGVSPFGREVVAEMNRLGIMVDISHVSDSAFYQVMRITKAPAIASHSSCRAFTPGFERNMNDDMIKKLGENGGVILINFGSTFLDSVSVRKQMENERHIERWLAENLLNEKDSLALVYINDYNAAHPMYSDVSVVADHIDHVVSLAGIDHVGLGSDFDGVGDSLPNGLKDVSMYPNLIFELLKRDYSEEDIAKICSGNFFRVWREVENVASSIR
jgi:membrane dipeptidase